MSAGISNGFALFMFGVSVVLLIIIIICLINGAVVLYGWRRRPIRQRRPEGKMLPAQPRVDRNPDRRPPESR